MFNMAPTPVDSLCPATYRSCPGGGYPLYVGHALLGILVLRILIGAGVRASVSTVLAVAAAFAVAWFIHIAVEAPSQQLYRSFRRVKLPLDLVFRSVSSQA